MDSYLFECPQFLNFNNIPHDDSTEAFFKGNDKREECSDEGNQVVAECTAVDTSTEHVSNEAAHDTSEPSPEPVSTDAVCEDVVSSPPANAHQECDGVQLASDNKPTGVTGQVAKKCRRSPRLREHHNPNSSVNSTGHASRKSQTKCTHPVTPSFMKRQVKMQFAGGAIKSSEELALEQMHMLQQQLVHDRQVSAESHRKAIAATGVRAHNTSAPPTCPQEFSFATDTRTKRHAMKTRGDDLGEDADDEFKRSLRQGSNSDKPVKLKVTLPQPFNFGQTNASKKRKRTNTEDKSVRSFKSVAEGINSFSSRTPDRFHSRPSKQKWEPSHETVKKVGVVEPHTPHLVAGRRKRAITAISQAELEEREVAEMKKNQFKAQPVNTRILHEANIGVPKVQPKQATVSCSFNLQANRRQQQHDSVHEEEDKYEFHAKAVPKAILKGVTGVKPAQSVAPTVPKSPAFALKNRLRTILNDDPSSPDDASVPPAHRGPMPHSGIPFQPRLQQHVTKVVPFSFAGRDEERLANKRQRIQHCIEEEAKGHEFKATLLPDSSPNLPEKVKLPATKQKPFHLEVDIRGANKTDELQQKLMLEEQQIAVQAQFKAKPFTHPKPFVPQRSKKPLTDANDFELETERRLRDRSEWEAGYNEKMAAAEQEKKARQERQEAEAREEAAKMRARTRFRSHGVRVYRKLNIRPSSTALTQPQSPCFSQRLAKCSRQ